MSDLGNILQNLLNNLKETNNKIDELEKKLDENNEADKEREEKLKENEEADKQRDKLLEELNEKVTILLAKEEFKVLVYNNAESETLKNLREEFNKEAREYPQNMF